MNVDNELAVTGNLLREIKTDAMPNITEKYAKKLQQVLWLPILQFGHIQKNGKELGQMSWTKKTMKTILFWIGLIFVDGWQWVDINVVDGDWRGRWFCWRNVDEN